VFIQPDISSAVTVAAAEAAVGTKTPYHRNHFHLSLFSYI